MSYFRASTANNQGWRPSTVALGNLVRNSGPDWKVASAQRDAIVRAGQQSQARRQRAANYRMSAVDAAARGQRMPARPLLSGLGINALDLNAQMVRGARYLFHFTYGGLGLAPSMTAISSTIAADSNFSGPVAAAESGGVQVSFTYNGQGSTVGNAGREMQNVINVFSLMGTANSLNFSAAEGGPATSSPAAGVTIFATSPDGTIVQFSDGSILDTTTGITTNADGTIRTAATTPPGASQQPGSFNFDITSLLGGMSVGVAIALGLGGVLLLKSL